MIARHVIAGLGLGALVAAGLAVSPALGQDSRHLARHKLSASVADDFGDDIGAFTPASADPRLAAALARTGLSARGFRFTPSESTKKPGHSVTVAVRARSTHSAAEAEETAATASPSPSVGLMPVAYNLGASVGWKRFALSSDVAHIDLAGKPGSTESVDVGLSYSGKRFSGRVAAGHDRPLADTPQAIADDPSYSIDVGGSYRLTHNLDVTAGVRYKSEQDRNRLQRLDDNRRDSQALYVGTAFRF